MNKAALLADLATVFTTVGTPEAKTAIGNIQPYIVTVFITGLSEKNKKPVASQKDILFYVHNEGLGDEAAYYGGTEPTNTVNADVTATTNSALSYNIIFISTEMRNRVMGFILKAINAVINEDSGVTNHSMRLKWAYDCSKSPSVYLDAYMVKMANNTTVRSSGNATVDGDLEWIVNSEIDSVATVYGFTN